MSFSANATLIEPPSKTNLVYSDSPVILYKYKLREPKLLTFIKNYFVFFALPKIKDFKEKEYAINVRFQKPVRWWCLTKTWNTFEELKHINLASEFEYLNDSNVDIANVKAIYFQLLTRDKTPVTAVPKKVGAKDLNNDCLFLAILQAFNYNDSHLNRNCKTPEGFKRKLNLGRKDKVPLSMFGDVEALFNIRLSMSGDAIYESNSTAKFHIYLHCKGEHVELRNPERDSLRPYINFEESKKVYSIYFDDEIHCYDGTTHKTVTDEDYNVIKNDFSNLLVKVDILEELEKAQKEYISTADGLKELTGGLVNLYKSSHYSMLAFDMFRKFTKYVPEPLPLSELEQTALAQFHGGLRYSKKGNYKNVYDYDVNKFYSFHLSSPNFLFPVCEPEYKTLNSDDFEVMFYNSYKFGLYKVILETNHVLFNYKVGKSCSGKQPLAALAAGKSQWLSHHDLKIAKMLGVSLKIDESGINFLNYDPKKCLSGFSVFKDYFDKCNEYVSKCKSNDVLKKSMKSLMASLWGSCCSKKKIVKRIPKSETIDLNEYHLNKVEFNENTTMVEVVKKNNVFKYNFARVCFITSFCRLKMVETVLECGLDNIAYINCDGFASLVEQSSLKVSDKMGDWKVKQYAKCVVNNSNSVIFTCQCGKVKKDCKC